ncbi:two-component sensor histidine kinase [Paenibacillus sp. 598K]|uniref:sensor histidine kinase n=1 Tax=Paenibacillus sp. 598K TaxID=1117987 RepID=UPI000FF9DA09|nr:histidine kinase [Paenibacillus sp. 598K]GBF72675.1 two-component sensor histidine kinase [Paenibacillus sp. 598K]
MIKLSLHHIKLRDKMLLIYFLCVLIPIVLTNVIFYQVITNNVKAQRMQDLALTAEKVANDLRDQFEIAVGISEVLNTDYFLNESLERQYITDNEYVDSYNTNVFWILNKYSPAYSSIKQIRLYTDNPTIIGGGYVLPITDAVEQTGWYRRLEVMGQMIMFRHLEQGAFGKENNYSIIRKLNYLGNFERWTKIVKIDLHQDAIRQAVGSATLDGDVYLLDEKGVIQYTNRSDLDWISEPVAFEASLLADDVITFEHDAGINNLSNWSIMLAVEEHSVLEEVSKSKSFVLYLAISNLLATTLVIIWITRSLSTRLVRLVRHVKQVKHGSFETVAHGNYRDEIGQLTSEFNRMTRQIGTLIDDVYVADIQKKDLELKRNRAQLHALQSQINPHFLFNALNTIRTRSLMKEETETARIIHNMAKIFRKSLQWNQDWVSIKEEMDLVLCFLEIQVYRFGEKLEYELHVDESAHMCKIPKMMLQTLVENASIHGIEQMKDPGRIEISIRRADGYLHCTIKDNGVGMSEERLNELLRSLYEGDEMGDSVGLKNLYYRLTMHYGQAASFEMKSEPCQGTEVRLRLPETPPEY